MKIVDIEVIELRIPGWTGDTFDGSYDNCLVLVHTDEGISGISEVDGVPFGDPRRRAEAASASTRRW